MATVQELFAIAEYRFRFRRDLWENTHDVHYYYITPDDPLFEDMMVLQDVQMDTVTVSDKVREVMSQRVRKSVLGLRDPARVPRESAITHVSVHYRVSDEDGNAVFNRLLTVYRWFNTDIYLHDMRDRRDDHAMAIKWSVDANDDAGAVDDELRVELERVINIIDYLEHRKKRSLTQSAQDHDEESYSQQPAGPHPVSS